MLADISGLLTETKAALKKLEAVTEEAAGKEEGKVQSEFYHYQRSSGYGRTPYTGR